jgi:hypothetical protein
MDHLGGRRSDPPLIYKKTNCLSQTLSRNTAHNKIQEKRIYVVLASVIGKIERSSAYYLI